MSEIKIQEWEHGDFSIISYVPQIEWQENCYLLLCGQEVIVIDPGFECEDIQKIISTRRCNVSFILLTHAHHDHLASAEVLSEQFSVPCLIDPNDKRLLMHAPMYGIRFAKRSFQLPKNVLWLDEEQKQKLFCEHQISVLHTPGHSEGSVCYFYKGVVFSGDTLVKGYVGRTDLPGGSREKLLRSLVEFFAYAKEHGTRDCYPGHGDAWPFSDALAWWNSKLDGIPEKKSF